MDDEGKRVYTLKVCIVVVCVCVCVCGEPVNSLVVLVIGECRRWTPLASQQCQPIQVHSDISLGFGSLFLSLCLFSICCVSLSLSLALYCSPLL